MLPHPLSSVRNRIDSDADYTVKTLASATGYSRSHIKTLALAGDLPGTTRPGVGYRWAGKDVLDAINEGAANPDFDHDKYAPSSLWRMGCRCSDCANEHLADLRKWRREISQRDFPEPLQKRLLALVGAGTSVKEAAELLGLTSVRVYAEARVDEEFGALLDKAAEALCVDAADHRCGTPTGYRRLACRGTACRLAHSPVTR
ncbi:hypothetical protein ACFV1L_06030 [Kitasatospora sp. NPDC059646]|uniref:hypothetical protein n=1 Tax=Kitasatospora sp. NPDC059646 TaxID=3346893 RepID=UPI00369383C8